MGGLAREGAVSVGAMLAYPPLSQASQLPHLDLHWAGVCFEANKKGDPEVAFCHCTYFLLNPGGTPCTLVSSHGPFGLMERLQPLLQR